MKISALHWQWLYGIGLGIVMLSMPFFNVGMSVGGIWLAGTWLTHSIYEGIAQRRLASIPEKFFGSPAAMLMAGFFALHLLGMIHTEDVSSGIRDLRIKLPLLFMPLAFSAMPPFNEKVRERFEALFTAAVALAASILVLKWLLRDTQSSDDVRDAHVFVSHIRFGLMVALAAFFSIRFSLKNGSISRRFWLIALVVLLLYIWFLQSITAVLSLLPALLLTGSRSMYFINKLSVRRGIGLGLLALALICSVYAYRVSGNYFSETPPLPGSLPELTTNGEAYEHHYGNVQVENGHFVWYFVAWEELEPAWNERSTMAFWAEDQMGQPLTSTLIRYLSSKGLTKDAEGVAALSDSDIRAIESGIANYLEPEWTGLEKRLHQIFFEVNAYRSGANPSGNSLLQRLEFWKAGVHLLKDRWLIGTGTGDLQRAFDRAYDEINSPLDDPFRHRAHNQFMSAWIALGVIGFLWICVLFIYPIVARVGRIPSNRSLAFFTIAFLSFFSEDTLETQAGITFFALFYCWYVVGMKEERRAEEEF